MSRVRPKISVAIRVGALAAGSIAAAAGQRASFIDAVHKGHAVGHEQDGVEAVRAALSAGGRREREGRERLDSADACVS